MTQIVDRGIVAGDRVDDLTGWAIAAWFLANNDKTRRKWLDARMGPGVAWRALDLAVWRVYFHSTDGRLTWEPSDFPAVGDPAILVPQWAWAPGFWGIDRAVIDIVAIDARDPSRVASLKGAVSALGEMEAELALGHLEPIAWHRDAMSWLRTGGNAATAQGLPDGVAHFFPFERGDITDRVIVEAREIMAADDAHAAELGRLVRRRRRELWPAPRVSVPDVDGDKAGA